MSEQPEDVQKAWQWTAGFPRFRWAYRRLVHIFREELASGKVDYDDIFSPLERGDQGGYPGICAPGHASLPRERKSGEPELVNGDPSYFWKLSGTQNISLR
jgi:hypothetical protein